MAAARKAGGTKRARARGKAASGRKPAATRKPRVKRAAPPMVYEEPQVQAVVPLRPGVLEPSAVLPPRAGARQPPAPRRWGGTPEVRLRCRACGHGNERSAIVCESCRALL